MKIANQFTVSAPIERAWDVLCDLEQVIPLMPGAQLTGHEGDDYLGKVKVKVGPVSCAPGISGITCSRSLSTSQALSLIHI